MKSRMNLLVLATCVCLAGWTTPAVVFGQPGRVYTPPPPPPPPPPSPPRTYTPPTGPNIQDKLFRVQQSQNMAAQQFSQFQASNQRDQTRMHVEDARRFANNPFSSGSNGFNGGANFPQGDVGVLVIRIEPNTQCELAGVQPGDILISYSGTLLRTTQQVQSLVKMHAGNAQAIELVVSRNNERMTFNVAPGRLGVIMRVR